MQKTQKGDFFKREKEKKKEEEKGGVQKHVQNGKNKE